MDADKMTHPQRWRETCNPFALHCHAFRLKEILGYPHAGNDVFHVRGIYQDVEMTAYIKAARQKGAAIDNEVAILSQLHAPVFPKVLDYDEEEGLFSVTEEMPGFRLSVIVGDNRQLASLSYMREYGETLSHLHKMEISAGAQKDRRYFHSPSLEDLRVLDLMFLADYFAHAPQQEQCVFCHGDFHYANVLWKEHHISAILDFELAGYGNRDFDIAWALFLRPGQKFLRTDAEREEFRNGYCKNGTCDRAAVQYYMAQCYVHFLRFCKEKDYCDYVRNWLECHCC